ncbi:MAG: accessory Sec system translocase SecA2 [Candidatus Aminicenantes bacterium]|nr:accessory Sec system translocase SecA2 [Candidatus Aminicenantes bacterium]
MPISPHSCFSTFLRKIRRARGESIETETAAYHSLLERIRSIDLTGSPDADLRWRADVLRRRAAAGESPDALKIETFALVLEAARRTLVLETHDCQLIAGLAMARGRVAELPTGEGKTLAAVYPVALFALKGTGVHILTFNDYLARRDAAWMGPIFQRLGFSVGCVQEGRAPDAKRAAYACDVTYATAKEAGFDYLRDGLAFDPGECVRRPFAAAIADEADSILIDEARVPLVIAGLAEGAAVEIGLLTNVVRSFVPGLDFETDAEHRNIFLTENGLRRLEATLGRGSLYDPGNERILEAVHCALHARELLTRDVDYIVRDGRIEIVDEFTGRVMEKRLWPDGIQAAVEAKEGLARRTEGKILGSITLQHFLRLYPRLAGMTATAASSADELREFYGLEVTIVPPHRPNVRQDLPDAIFSGREAKRRALMSEIASVHTAGRPILVGTLSVRESEELSADLRRGGIPHSILNAKNDEDEARIVAEAGTLGAVTISTNMAGRGTDIKLGGSDERGRGEVVALGGLYVIGTNRHESLRIDRQLRGRSGRQGDPGSTRFFISLDDDLFERYGLTEIFFRRHRIEPGPEEIGAAALRREISHAQRVIEGQNFDIRRTLHKFSSLVEIQRRIVRERREAALLDPESAGFWEKHDPEGRARASARFGPKRLARFETRAILSVIDRAWADHLAWIADTRESIHLVSLGGKTPIQEFATSATEEFLAMMRSVDEKAGNELDRLMDSGEAGAGEPENLRGPSSTWTYLVNEDQFGDNVQLINGRNIGFAAAFANPFNAMLLTIVMILRRFRRPKGGPSRSKER